MKRSFLLFSFTCIFVFSFALSASAFTVYERSGSALLGDPYVDTSQDVYVQKFDPSVVYRIEYGDYTDDSFTTVLTPKTVTGGNFYGDHYFRCNSYYKAQYYDASGTLVGTLKFHATELVNPTCESGADGGLPPSGGGGEPPPSDSEFTLEDCATAICDCIRELQGVNETISANTGGILSKTGEMVSEQIKTNTTLTTMDGKLTEMGTTLNSIDATTKSIDLWTQLIYQQLVTPNQYGVPDSDWYNKTHEENKPDMPDVPFVDSNVYFTDQGDSSDVLTPFPSAPEPTDNWDGIYREAEKTIDPVRVADPVNVQDPVLVQDEVLVADPVLVQDEVPVADPVLVQDKVPVADPVPIQDPVLVPDPVETGLPTWIQ